METTDRWGKWGVFWRMMLLIRLFVWPLEYLNGVLLGVVLYATGASTDNVPNWELEIAVILALIEAICVAAWIVDHFNKKPRKISQNKVLGSNQMVIIAHWLSENINWD